MKGSIEIGNRVCMVTWLLSFTHRSQLTCARHLFEPRACVWESVRVCLLRMWQVTVVMHDSFCVLYRVSVCVRVSRCQYPCLPFPFLTLLSPWQPPDSSSAAHSKYFSPLPLRHVHLPHPIPPSPLSLPPSVSLSSICTLYSTFISRLQCLHLLLFPHPWLSPSPLLCLHATITWKSSSFLTVVFAESLSFICAALSLSLQFSILCSLLIASHSSYQFETSPFLSLNFFTLPLPHSLLLLLLIEGSLWNTGFRLSCSTSSLQPPGHDHTQCNYR